MPKVKLTVKESKCRCGYCKKGDTFIVEDLCPPICHELWNCMYPLIYAIQNGADLDYGSIRSPQFDTKCPDNGRVCIHGERIDD
ncbi:TIGR04076 family protein [Anaerocolumna sp. MB42-C2]|uniref:TIGR04076 family protein n=1 Tax=Anaerocolumna sp. MB42-C2 TaxID=3070997 RepID=UPI0027E00C51|nr:TIGR04076 family protein [Anaerocolumna sp. MB42-C2]WMJ90455.1 TIGR04076 family protein [Anaerocolumna sp. MB42-C2]